MALVGDSAIEPSVVDGKLEDAPPNLMDDHVLQTALDQAPAVQIAQASVERAEAALAQARRQSVPDLLFRGGLQQNREQLTGSVAKVGWQGFAEVGLQLKLFDRNQGGVNAATAEVDRARLEQQRVQLLLRERAASFLAGYRTASLNASHYRESMLPKMERTYSLASQRHDRMQASYLQVLETKAELLQLRTDYISALAQSWTSSVALQGYLQNFGLEAPTRPEEVERSI